MLRHTLRSLLWLPLLAATACSDLDSITDITEPPVSAGNDAFPPLVTLTDPPNPFQLGDTLKASVRDDQRVDWATLVIADSANQVLLEDSVRVGRRDKDLAFVVDSLPADFPYGEKVFFTVRARDAVGKVAYPGEANKFPTTLKDAVKKSFTITEGRVIELPAGSKIGSLAYDLERKRVYLTDTPKNAVRAFSLATFALEPWSVRVGSQPDLLAIRPGFDGEDALLAVFNDGGLDVSVVSVTGSDAQEIRRIPVPYLTVKTGEAGTDSAQATFRQSAEVHSLLIQCAGTDSACSDPTLYLGTQPLEGESASPQGATLTQTIRIFDNDPLARYGVIAPLYNEDLNEFSNLFEKDEAIWLEVYAQSSTVREDSLIFRKDNVSRCGTFGLGALTIATSDRPGGDIFVGGQSGGLCGESVVRYQHVRSDSSRLGEYRVVETASYFSGRDPALRGVKALDTNADASLVAVMTSDAVFLTDGRLRRLARLDVPGAQAIAFLEGMRFGGGTVEQKKLLAVSTSNEIRIYETRNYTQVGTLRPAAGIASSLIFLETDGRGGLAVVGLNADRTAFVVVETSVEALSQE